MASKRELVEAQSYSRRRLLTAFTSGAPGGQELEATKPMRGVVAGVLLTVVVLLGSLAWGLLAPTLPDGWDENSLVVTDTGARYVAIDGTLHPVRNATSAYLAIPSTSFHVVDVDAADVADAPRGPVVGIEGAPDAPPAREALVGTGWVACVAPGGVAASVGVDVVGQPAQSALVRVAGETYLVVDGMRHLVEPDDETAVLRALGLDTTDPVTTTAQWLNLFPPGADLAPLTVADAGAPVRASGAPQGLRVGDVLHQSGVGQDERWYVVLANGRLAPLSEFALGLYELGSGQDAAEVPVTAAQIGGLKNATTPLVPPDWPTDPVEPLDADLAPCARLTSGDATTDPSVALEAVAPPEAAGIAVAPGAGALVVARTTAGGAGTLALLDETGTLYALPGADDETVARLGYQPTDVRSVPPAWAALFPTGPDLTTAAALDLGSS